jgi:hypothetical protein
MVFSLAMHLAFFADSFLSLLLPSGAVTPFHALAEPLVKDTKSTRKSGDSQNILEVLQGPSRSQTRIS